MQNIWPQLCAQTSPPLLRREDMPVAVRIRIERRAGRRDRHLGPQGDGRGVGGGPRREARPDEPRPIKGNERAEWDAQLDERLLPTDPPACEDPLLAVKLLELTCERAGWGL